MSSDDFKIISLAVQLMSDRQCVAGWEAQTVRARVPDTGESHQSMALGGTGAKSPVQMPQQGTVTVHLIALDVCFYLTVAAQANRLENSRLAWISGILFMCVQHGTW